MKIKEIKVIGVTPAGRTVFEVVLQHLNAIGSFHIGYKEEDKYVYIGGVKKLATHQSNFDHTLWQKILSEAIGFIQDQSPEDPSPYALVDEVKNQCDAFIASQKKGSTQ